jgi:serine/threonine-protein kinase SRPK3
LLIKLHTWDLLKGEEKRLFKINQPSREATAAIHLGRMIGLLGQPPNDILERGGITEQFFDEEG